MTLSSSDKKPLKRIAHHLQPVVQVGDAGVSAGIIDETNARTSRPRTDKDQTQRCRPGRPRDSIGRTDGCL